MTRTDETDEKEDLLNLCVRYLDDKNIILWGRAFDLHDKLSRRQAAEFLAEEISAVFAHE